MTIEIKQLVIRATVQSQLGASSSPTAAASDTSNLPVMGGSEPEPPTVDTRAIVDACVRQVLRELKRRKER